MPASASPDDFLIPSHASEGIRTRAQAVFDRLGLDLPAAIDLFLTEVARRDSLPFETPVTATAPTDGQDYDTWKQAFWESIEAAEAQANQGQVVSLDDLKTRTLKVIEQVEQGKRKSR